MAPHPPYSPDFALLEYHLLGSLKNSLIASCTIYTRSAIEGGGVDAELAFTLSDACIKAIERLRCDDSFDVLVSDIAMPGDLSGIDVANEVASRYPGMRVVLTSGHPLSHFPPLPANVSFLPKPDRIKQLVDVVRALGP